MKGAVSFIDTDFSRVLISPKTLTYLESLDPDWLSISSNKRLRSQHARIVKQKVAAVETAAMILSEIAWAAGGELTEI